MPSKSSLTAMKPKATKSRVNRNWNENPHFEFEFYLEWRLGACSNTAKAAKITANSWAQHYDMRRRGWRRTAHGEAAREARAAAQRIELLITNIRIINPHHNKN